MSSIDAAFARAERAAESGDWPKARKHFKLVLRRRPDNVDALFQLARVFMQEAKSWNPAANRESLWTRLVSPPRCPAPINGWMAAPT